MPKLGMEPIRREALVKATIAEIGRTGSLDVTVAQIARRAGMSSALAHHYFGSKEDIFLAAMRHILTLYGAEVRGALAAAEGGDGRIKAIWIVHTNPAVSMPDADFVREALAKCPTVVVSDVATSTNQRWSESRRLSTSNR